MMTGDVRMSREYGHLFSLTSPLFVRVDPHFVAI